MFIKSFRLGNILFGLAAGLLAVAIAGNLVMMGLRVFGASKETVAPIPPEDGIIQTVEGVGPSTDGKEDAKKVVYLTFDDGPSAATTEILDVLKEEEVPATFFVIGATTERGKGLYQRIVDEGHALGIHSYSHRYDEIYKSASAYLADYKKLSDHLESVVGVRPQIFRFPGGSSNKHADKAVIKKIKEEMIKEGNVWFDWNAIAKDDHAKPTPAKEMFENIVKSGKDRDQILVLMHDDALRTTAPECIRLLIAHYRELGYTFEKLTPDTPPIQFG